MPATREDRTIAGLLGQSPGWLSRGALVCLGVLAGLGQVPWSLWPLTIFSLSLLLIWPSRTGWRGAALDGWAFGLGYFGLTLHWIVDPFLVEPARDGWLAPFGVMFMCGGMALFWGLALAASQRVMPGRVARAAALAAAEMLRSHLWSGFPWALFGHIWIETPIAQAAAYVGPHGLTLMTVGAALLLSALWRGPRWLVLALTPAIWLWFALVPAPAAVPDGARIRLVQPNARQDQKWDSVMAPIFEQRLLDATGAGRPPDLIVWPESAVPYLLEYSTDTIERMKLAARGAPVVFGINRRVEARYYNSLVLMDAKGDLASIYDKTHLVPFGEYFPLAEIAARFGLHGLAASEGGGFSEGSGGGLIDLPRIGMARALICYEGIFAEEILKTDVRPRLMILITNDSWFGDGAGPKQHLALARFRAIEQGLPMVRVANTGISAMIDSSGRLTGQMGIGQEGYLDLLLPDALPATLYSKTGDIPAYLLLVVFVLSVVSLNRRRRIDLVSSTE